MDIHNKAGKSWRPDDLVLRALLRNTRLEQLHTRAKLEELVARSSLDTFS